MTKRVGSIFSDHLTRLSKTSHFSHRGFGFCGNRTKLKYKYNSTNIKRDDLTAIFINFKQNSPSITSPISTSHFLI